LDSFIRIGEYLASPNFLSQFEVLTRVCTSNAGGGGERVLWTAIAALQRNEPDVISVVYSGDIDATKQDIINKVKVRSVDVPHFIAP
jgi:hypothetical protein